MTNQEMEAVASKAAEKAVNDVLQKLGIDASNFRESQADFSHLRKSRLASEQVGKLAARTILTVVVSGFCGALWVGFQNLLNK